MIIGQFNDSFPPIMDGVAAVTLHYAQETGRLLGDAGKSYVVTPAYPYHEDRYEDIEVVRYYSLPVSFRPPYRFGLPYLDITLRKNLFSVPFNLVHAQCPFGSGQLAVKIARDRNIPLVASFHSKYYDDILAVVRSETIARTVLRSLMRVYDKADEVWTVNDSTIPTLREYGYKGHVHVIHNGTDMPKSEPQNRRGSDSERVCAEYELDPDVPVLLFIGQHVWQKNLKLLIEALALLKVRLTHASPGRKPFQMIFIGGGDAAVDLRELCSQLHLAQEVRFLGVIRDRAQIHGFFERADLFLFPSLYDTSALSIREAASALCPTVMIAGSTTAEGIVDGENGYLSGNDASDYADRIFRALADPEERLRIGIQAQETLYRTWADVGRDVLERYQYLLSQPRPKPNQRRNSRAKVT